MGSVGSIIGAVAGGIIGFFIGGPLGAVYGAAIGFGIGSVIDPVRPDVPPPGKPQVGKLNITTADEGLPVADALGTTKITGNILWYSGNRTVEVPPPQQEQGKGGIIGPAVGQVTGANELAQGYHYYLTWAVGICSGPADTLYTVYKGEQCVWEGELNRPESGGEETVSIPDIGSMTFFFGTTDQVAPAAMTNLLEDPTLSPNYRRLCYAFFNDGYLGQYNRLPIFKFVFKKSVVLDFNSDKQIETYFYNPAHAIYYILSQMIGLDIQYINNATFNSAAERLFVEDRGVNILFDRQAQALTYLETILQHIDGVLRWGIDGRLHLKLMRADEDTSLMQVVSEDMMLDDFSFDRKSWLDTQNEVKVQYPLLVVGDCELCLSEEVGAPVIAVISQNGQVGTYNITDGCPPFDVYIRTSSSSFGPWIFKRTTVGREFNDQISHVGCGLSDIDREIKVVDSFHRDSNFLDIRITATTLPTWDGDKEVDRDEGAQGVEVSWTGGSPPFHLSSSHPFITFDTQFYRQFTDTGLQHAMVYWTGQACGGYRIRVTDNCNKQTSGIVRVLTGFAWNGAESAQEIEPSGTAVVIWYPGIPPYDIELVGMGTAFQDVWLDAGLSKTAEDFYFGEGITLHAGPEACGDVEIQVTDSCYSIFGNVSAPPTCHYLIYARMYTGFGVDGSTVAMLWDTNTNAKAVFAKNSSGDVGENPAPVNEFTYAISGHTIYNDIDYIHPYGKNGYGGILGGAALYEKDPDEQMQAPIAISACGEGAFHTCSFWGVDIEELTDLCDVDFIDQSPPADNYYRDQDLTEYGFMSANFNAHFEMINHDDYQDSAHLMKINDQRTLTQVVGEDPGDTVFQNWTYDIDGEQIAPVTGTTKKFSFNGQFNRWKANRAANWNSGGNYTSGSAKVPYIQEWMNNGTCHGIHSTSREQVAGAFVHTLGIYSMDKWYPYPNQYITLHHYATAGYATIPGIDIESVDITEMFGRNVGFENALEEMMQFWYDYNGYDSTDIEAGDLFDEKMWPEILLAWVTEMTPPTTTTV